MPQSNQDDNKLIKLLQELPDMKDPRPMDEIYRNVTTTRKKRSRKPVFIPILTAMAALLIFAIMIPVFFQNASGDKMSMQEESKADREIAISEKKAMDQNSIEKTDESMDTKMFEMEIDHPSIKTAVYEEDIKGHELIHFGVVSEDAFVIPITLLGPEKSGADWPSVYKEEAAIFDPHAFGFQEFQPLIDALDYDQQSGIMHVTIGNDAREFFERNEKYIMSMVEYTVRNENVELVKFVDEKGLPVELGAYGIVPDLTIEQFSKKAHYAYTLSDGHLYIVPADLESDSFIAALEDMKTSPNDFYEPLIPKEIAPVGLQEENGRAVVRFKENLNLDHGDLMANKRMLDGILLTAKEFGITSVKFENITPADWEQFHFDEPVNVPYSANLIE